MYHAEFTVICSLVYIAIVAIAYRPKQNVTVNHYHINYFPEVEEPTEYDPDEDIAYEMPDKDDCLLEVEPIEVIPCPWQGETVETVTITLDTEPVKPVLYLLPPAKEVPTKKSTKPTKKTPKTTDNNLSAMSIRQLKKLASERKIPRYSNLTKAQLIEAIAA